MPALTDGARHGVPETGAEADRLLAARQWGAAAALLEPCSAASGALWLKRNLARNLAAIQEHRPEVYGPLVAAPSSGRYQPIVTPSGAMTIVERRADGHSAILGPGADPAAEARRMASDLEPRWSGMTALVLAGVGDGYLLSHLGGSARLTAYGAERPVIVLEPDPELLAHVLLIHDLSAATGPIAEPRFSWFVGPEWEQRLQEACLRDPWAAAPELMVSQGPRSGAIVEGVRAVQGALETQARQLSDEAQRHYGALSDDLLLDVLSAAPSRKPRVLLPASRFTTVLQYAYRDAAKAFAELGWDVTLIQEPAAHQRLSCSAIRHCIATIKPDLVLLIDHLRYESPDLFPPNLPVATWTQDHLTNLTCEQAGRSIGPRDFVWTVLSPMYATLYAYPRRQCIPMAKLVHVPARLQRHTGVRRELLYVSHASDEPHRLVDDLVHVSARSEAARALVQRCARAILRCYEEGACVSTLAEAGRIVDDAARDLQVELAPAERYAALHLLFYRLNNALYRQQALAWAIDAAEAHGLRLRIHGRGWERHSRFAPYAAGPIENGPALEVATREACIALQIVPYYCLHQRLLEGLVAGGFFLIRSHPSDRLLPSLSAFVRRHVPEDARTDAEARAAVDGTLAAELDRLLASCELMADLGVRIDLVEWIRVCQASGLFTEDDQALPRLDEVSFGSREELGQCVARFVDAPALRREAAEAQQESVARRLSYRSGLERAIHLMRERIAAGAAPGCN